MTMIRYLMAMMLMAGVVQAADRPVLNGRLGPPTPETCFWSSRDYTDLPERGPQQAAGIVLWNHGQAGSGEPSWQNGPSPVIRMFAEAGWDVLLVQRNPRCEGKWEHKGKSYVDNLLHEVDQARKQGYRRVLVAGQSYGAGTAMGAGASEKVDGVLAFALSHGRGNCRDVGSFKPWMIPQQEEFIRDSLRQARAPRLLVSMVSDDHCFNHSFTPMITKELAAKTGTAYIHFDESAPFSGHSAAMKRDYAAMYGPCIFKFFTQEQAPAAGRTTC